MLLLWKASEKEGQKEKIVFFRSSFFLQ